MLSSTYEHSDGVDRLYFPAFDTPETNNGIAEGLDAEGVKQFYSRMTFKGLAVTSMYGTRRRDVPTASSQTLFNSQLWREQTTDRHGMLDAYYVRPFGDTRLTLRASYDRFSYSRHLSAGGRAGRHADAGRRRPPASARAGASSAGITQPLRFRQTLRAGVEFIDNIDQDQSAELRQRPGAVPRHRPLVDAAGAVSPGRDQARALVHRQRRPALRPLPAVRPRDAARGADRPAVLGAVVQVPVWQRVPRAQRVRAERRLLRRRASTRCGPESIDTHEFVWERYINDRLRTSVSTYWYKADRLITPTLDDSAFLGATFVNQGQVRAKGLELEAQMRLQGRIAGARQLRASERRRPADARRAAELAAPRRQGARQPARTDGRDRSCRSKGST